MPKSKNWSLSPSLPCKRSRNKRNPTIFSLEKYSKSPSKGFETLRAKRKLKSKKPQLFRTKLDNLQSSLVLPILISLMENALQAKKGARVRIHSEKKREKIRILVSDDAGESPRIKRKALFSPQRSEKKQGTGLGLALAMQLAESMDATLELLHSDKKGSTFCLSFRSKA